MGSHAFNFAGGDQLSTMGATWFVSYAYYTYVDKKHTNWQLVETYPNRISVFNRTDEYHRFWLEKVLEMDNDRLNTNEIKLKADRTKEMARKLLSKLGG
jgi:hypothetical protein